MARMRTVHPGIWTDEDFVTLSFPARLLLIGLGNEAFDDGVFQWKPRTLKIRLMPADGVDFEQLFDELIKAGFVRKFEHDGKPYGAIKNFRKWQKPQKPKRSEVLPDTLRKFSGDAAEGEIDTPQDTDHGPVQDEYHTSTIPVPDEYHTGTVPISSVIGEGRESKGRKNSEDKSSGAAAAEPPSSPELLDLDRHRGNLPPGQPATPAGVIPLHPPPDERAVLFDVGLRTVRKLTKSPDRASRGLIGKWLKALGDDCAALNRILVDALERQPAEPVAWIERAVRARSARKPPDWPDADDREGWIAWVERSGDPRAKVTTDQDGRPRAELAGIYLDWFTGALCDAGRVPVRGVDWRAALDWLADGINAHEVIVPAVRRAARNAPPADISSMAFFDKAVRAARPTLGAA